MAQTAQPLDITAASNILKKVYTKDQIESQLNDDAMVYAAITKTNEYHDSVGDKAVGFVKTGRNVGVSSRSLNGGTLGAAGHQQTNKWELDYTAHYVQIKILGTTIAKMATDRQAATRAITLEADGAIEDVKKDICRQLYSNGDALIARTGAATSTTIPLYAATPQDALLSNDVLTRGWLQVGEYVDIGTTADEDSAGGDLKITAVTVSETAPSITVDSSITSTTSTYVSKADNRSATTSYEMNGLPAVTAATGAYAGLTDGTWVGNVVTASASLSRAHMQALWNQIRQYSGKVNRILTSLDHQTDYYNLLQNQVRFAKDSEIGSSTGGNGPLFNNVSVDADPDCLRGVMYMLDTTKLFLVTGSSGPEWATFSNSGDKLAWVQGEDAYTGYAKAYHNLGTERRRSQGRISAITVNT